MKMVKGIPKLNKRSDNISAYFLYQKAATLINEIEYTNDMYYDNHAVKSVKYKQFLFFFKNSIVRQD